MKVAGRYRREGGLKGGKRKRRLQGHLVQKKRKWFDLGIKVPKNGQWVKVLFDAKLGGLSKKATRTSQNPLVILKI